MSCWHGWHGCGPQYGGPHGRGWYEPAEWYEEVGWPIHPRYRRSPRLDREAAVDRIVARLDELRDEVRSLETELMNLRGAGEAAAGKT